MKWMNSEERKSMQRGDGDTYKIGTYLQACIRENIDVCYGFT